VPEARVPNAILAISSTINTSVPNVVVVPPLRYSPLPAVALLPVTLTNVVPPLVNLSSIAFLTFKLAQRELRLVQNVFRDTLSTANIGVHNAQRSLTVSLA